MLGARYTHLGLALLLAVVTVQAGNWSVSEVDQVKGVSNAGFIGIPYKDTVYVSCFGGLSSELAVLHNGVAENLGVKLKWPNEIEAAPSEFFSGGQGILINDGFLVPGKSTGMVYYLNTTLNFGIQGTLEPLLPEKNGYFYHRTMALPLASAGAPVLVTARATTSAVAGQVSGSGELVILTSSGDKKFEVARTVAG